MKNKKSPEKIRLTKRKKGLMKGLMHDFVNSYKINYERDYLNAIYTNQLPTTLDIQRFLQKRAVFLKNIECEYQLYTIRFDKGEIWLGIGFIYEDEIIRRRTHLEKYIKDLSLKNSIINATTKWP